MSEKNKDDNLMECPMSLDEVDLFAPGAQKYWYESYKFLHAESPVHKIPGEGTTKDTDGFILSKYEDIALVVKDIIRFPPPVVKELDEEAISGVAGFQSENEEMVSRHDPSFLNAMQTSILNLRPNEELWKAHKRQLTDPWVGPGAPRHTKMITDATNKLIDNWIDSGKVEFVSEFAMPLPQMVMANVIGFPLEDIPLHKKWGDAMVMPFVYGQGHRNLLTKEQSAKMNTLLAEFTDYVVDKVAEKKKNPKEDMISFLTDVVYEPYDRKLTDLEIVGVAYAMIIGGLETTQYAIAHQAQILVENNDLYIELKNDRDKVSAFVEESLRVRSPTQGLSTRMTTQDEIFQGIKVPKGSILHLRYGAANVDPSEFDCPHQLDLGRKGLARHLTFSQGHRTCPGNGISRLEQNITWNCLMDRIEKFEYTPETNIEYQPGIMLGTLELKLNFKVN
ncbi:MAG: cytochrome P450 [Pseudomonadota bacterium]|nr:cytochrome P450 [Pseudomonadota bacterium]